MIVGLTKSAHMWPIKGDEEIKNKHGDLQRFLKPLYLYQINFQILHSPNKVVGLPTSYLNT